MTTNRSILAPDKHYAFLKEELKNFMTSAGHEKVVLGVSGGLDSAIVATLAADALGPHNVLGVAMPSPYSSKGSLLDARELMANLNAELREISILPLMETFHATLPLTGLAAENLQARIRGALLMGVGNEEHRLVLTTGNLSEITLGYCTMYGDTVGAFAPLAASYKTELYGLARWRNEGGVTIPLNTIEKPPSAELSPQQKDSDSLPEYNVLDAMLKEIAKGANEESLLALFPKTDVFNVLARIKRNSWKLKQLPPGPARKELMIQAGASS